MNSSFEQLKFLESNNVQVFYYDLDENYYKNDQCLLEPVNPPVGSEDTACLVYLMDRKDIDETELAITSVKKLLTLDPVCVLHIVFTPSNRIGILSAPEVMKPVKIASVK